MKNKDIFSGKVAWITGASSGIGEALVHEFAKNGAVVAISSNDPEGLVRVKEACNVNSTGIICVPFDLSRPNTPG